MAGKLRLKFDNLPLVEAAVRASFNVPKALSYALINSVHAELKSQFPALAESTQIEVAPGSGQFQAEFGPGCIPGAVYTGHPLGVSVHVQPQVVVARWSKRPGLDDPHYPDYERLRDSLWIAVEAFERGCGTDYPGIAVVNMSYVNFIPALDPAAILKTYFSEDAHLRAMDKARQVRKLEAAWSEGDDLDVRFALEQAAAKLPDGITQGYRLTTVAGLRLGGSVDPRIGLERVHDALQEFFNKLISPEAKKEWKLRENQNG